MMDEPELDDDDGEMAEGAAVFPSIPPDLGVHPLLLCVLHSLVFLQGSSPSIVEPDAATEATNYLAEYLQRLSGIELQRLREDLECLTAFAKQERWPDVQIEFLQHFLQDFDIGSAAEFGSGLDDDEDA